MPLNNLTDQSNLIDRSWKRCHNFGLSPSGPVNEQVLTGKRLKEVLEKNKDLITNAASAFEKLYPNSARKGLVSVIVDRHGTILYKTGSLGMENEDSYLAIGSNWSEKNQGTNAMGVAIYEKKPVITHADQHFHIKNQFLTCAASPIYSADGEFIGAVNVSARKEFYHPFTISLTSVISDTIQTQLLLSRTNNEKLLALKEMEATAALSAVPLVSIDNENVIKRANNLARSILGEDCIGKEFHKKLDCISEVVTDNTKRIYSTVISLNRPVNKSPENKGLYTIRDIAGSCPKIVKVKKLAEKAAYTDYPVIIYGESGTGKELIAQSLHTRGPRSDNPFIAVNCGAIPESLVESELFGYEKGAFTGAKKEGVPGKFEAAKGGTLFLDEIGDMSLKAQSALMRVLQEKKVTRIGGTKPVLINARIVAATNKNLKEEVLNGRFREDLYYRLKGIIITIPPLRKRTDILEMATHLMKKLDNPSAYLSREAQQRILSYHYPGNVRELNSILMEASFWAEDNEITAEDLKFEDIYEQQNKAGLPENTALINTEKEAIKTALKSTGWNISRSAKLLQISRNTLYLKIKKYNLQEE
ncbi:sigma-54-dependent Fis family transcriptional regulator [Evansella clarkii]|uniref:sigma-54-dependent Fis family transcriptional regulator n=1 Tax=Evansella clarkii TaxID=79879 RepID=UPI000B437E37|nr:sigma-54-dependent Fis family transcriptional regulator [Evansella clarkii]